jgi:hypothetical protein
LTSGAEGRLAVGASPAATASRHAEEKAKSFSATAMSVCVIGVTPSSAEEARELQGGSALVVFAAADFSRCSRRAGAALHRAQQRAAALVRLRVRAEQRAHVLQPSGVRPQRQTERQSTKM